MTQTIRDLWNGSIAPCKHCGAQDADVKHLTDLMERNRQVLCNGLTPVQAEHFQKYVDCSEEYLQQMLELAFAAGFSLGSKLVIESVL